MNETNTHNYSVPPPEQYHYLRNLLRSLDLPPPLALAL